MSRKIPGIYVEIKGDYTQLKKDTKQARQLVTEQAKGMSNALNNALSPRQISGGINKIISDLTVLSRASQVTSRDFAKISADTGSLNRNLGLTDRQFASLQQRMLNTKAEKTQERALKNIAKAAGLSKGEIRALGVQMGISKKRIESAVSSLNKSSEGLGSRFGGFFSRTAAKGLLWQYAMESAFRAVDKLVFDFAGRVEIASIGMASAFLTQGKYVDELTGKVLAGERAFGAAQQTAADTIDKLKGANFETIATLDQLIKGYQVTLPVALARGFDNDKVIQFTLAMVQAAGAIDDTGQLMNQLGEETRSLLTGNINPRTSRIATALGIRNEDVRQFKGNADELFGFLMSKLSAYSAAGKELQGTWKGIWSNLKDISIQASAEAFFPVFESVKSDLKDIVDQTVIIDETTGKLRFSDEFMKQVSGVKSAVFSIVAEMRRLAMLLDKVGGTMTTIGALVTFGSWDKKMREWNRDLERRYKLGEKKLQELANFQEGLSADGTLKTDANKNIAYNPNKKPDEADDKALRLIRRARRKELDAFTAFQTIMTTVEKSAADVRMETNKQEYEWGLKSLQDYLDKKHSLSVQSIDADIAVRKKEVTGAKKALNELAGETSPKGVTSETARLARAAAETKLYNTQKQLVDLQGKRQVLEQKQNDENKNAAYRQGRVYEQAGIELLKLTDRTVEAQQAQNKLFTSSKEYARLEGEAATGNKEAIVALAEVKERLFVLEHQAILEKQAAYVFEQSAVAELTGDWDTYYEKQVELLKIEIARAEVAGEYTEALKAQLREAEKMLDPFSAFEAGFEGVSSKWSDTAANMVELGETTAQAMHDSFSDFFFDALQGEFDSFSDYAKSFLSSINRALANSMASDLTALMSGGNTGDGGLIGKGIGMIGGLIAGLGTKVYGAGGIVDTFGAGGWIKEPIAGYGLDSGKRYLFGEGGEDELITPRSKLNRSGDISSNTTHHNTVVMNISTPDVSSFRASQSQLMAHANQSLQFGQRNL